MKLFLDIFGGSKKDYFPEFNYVCVGGVFIL